MLRRRILVPLPGIAVALTLAGCGKEPPARIEPPRPVRSIVVTPSPVATVLTLPAEIRPRIEARYGFRIGGKIARRMVSVGDRVVPGQVLAQLDPQDLAPAVAAARAALEATRTDERLAATELARLKDLRDKSFISAGQLDRQQAAFDAAGSRARSAQAQLDQATNSVEFQALKADVAGRVLAVEAEAGQVVAAGQVVVRVARDAGVEALVNVPEGDVAQARAAAEWLVTVPALGGRALKGRIRELSPVADAASRTYPMRLTLSGELTDLHWGMTAVASLARESAMGLFVPLTALHSRDGQPHLWLIDPPSQTVRLQPIRTDGFVDERVRVVDGLKAGDRVVTAGANLLTDGQRIKLADAPK